MLPCTFPSRLPRAHTPSKSKLATGQAFLNSLSPLEVQSHVTAFLALSFPQACRGGWWFAEGHWEEVELKAVRVQPVVEVYEDRGTWGRCKIKLSLLPSLALTCCEHEAPVRAVTATW